TEPGKREKSAEGVSLVWRHLQVIEIHAELRVGEDAWTALPVRDRIYSVDHPSARLGFGGGPGFPLNAGLSLMLVLDAQLQVVRDVRLAAIVLRSGPLDIVLPRGHFESLAIAECDQRVTLRDDADVAHLAALFVDTNIGLNRVVRPIRRSHENADALE